MLLENPSTYLAFAESDIAEVDFLAEITRRTGCGLLLDVNNVFVSAINQQTNPISYIDAFPLAQVWEIHLGGHDEDTDETGAPLCRYSLRSSRRWAMTRRISGCWTG